MTVREIDVFIAGAGPAGSSAAIALAYTGHSVLIAERAKFPRAHIGESLPPKIDTLFAILGVVDKVKTAGFVRMSGTTVHQGAEVVAHEFDPVTKQLGYQVDRARFDAILLDRARALGAEVIEGATVTELVRDDNKRICGARYRREDGEVVTVASRFVVDASGSRSVVSKMLGTRRRESIHTMALCGYWRDAAISPEFPATNTLFEMLPEGWIWSVLLDDGRRNITVGLDAETLKSSPRSAVELYREMVSASRLVSPLVARATFSTELTAHDATWFSSDVYAGDGFLLAGDAACFIDPLTSHGVYKAMHSGIGGAAVINTVLSRPADAAMAIRHHNDQQSRAFARYADISITFYQGSPYASLPFWEMRTRRETELMRSFSETQLAEQRARREKFAEQTRRLGGKGVMLRARPQLLLERRSVAESNFIVMRPALVSAEDPLFLLDSEQFRVDVAVLFPLLDGRTLEAVFEAYVAGSGERRSSDLARRLTQTLNVLVERFLVEPSALHTP